MKAFQFVPISILSAMAILVTGRNAWAIALPDNSSCSTTGANGCFKISNTASGGIAVTGSSSAGVAVKGTATGTGVGVSGSSGSSAGVAGTTVSGYGVFGSGTGTGMGVRGAAASGIGVQGLSSSGHGVEGNSNGGFGISGVKGISTGQGFGVSGYSTGGGYGVYGENPDLVNGWAGLFAGRVNASGGYFQISDERVKKEIQDAPYGLDQLLRLRPVSYRWKNQAMGEAREIGLIAQEVQKIVPEVVTATGPAGMRAVNYTALLPVMIKAVQEQHKIILAQQKALDAQEARIASLERAGKTSVSSLMTGGVGAGLVFALLPLGLVAVRRRRGGRAS